MMTRGRAAAGEVGVSEFVEHGDVVMARVRRRAPDGDGDERFVLAEVHGGEITHLRAFADETEARAALAAGSLHLS